MICAIVLAAGKSSRMGVQKLLLPFGGTTVIARIARRLLDSTIDKVYVVVGYQSDRIAAELSGLKVSLVENPDFESGMLSSVRCGIGSLPRDCDGVLVALGDQPAITSELVDQMIRTFARTDKGIIVPTYQGKRGHPILFAGRFCSEIMTKYDEIGLCGLLRAYPDDVFEMTASTSAVLCDMDFPQDYQRELTLLEESVREDNSRNG